MQTRSAHLLSKSFKSMRACNWLDAFTNAASIRRPVDSPYLCLLQTVTEEEAGRSCFQLRFARGLVQAEYTPKTMLRRGPTFKDQVAFQ